MRLDLKESSAECITLGRHVYKQVWWLTVGTRETERKEENGHDGYKSYKTVPLLAIASYVLTMCLSILLVFHKGFCHLILYKLSTLSSR